MSSMLALVMLSGVVLQALGDDMVCSHSDQGSCNANGLFGFCSMDTKKSLFGCDESKYCVSKKTQLLKLGKGGGCFGNGICCCNAGSFCNNVFMNHLAKAANAIECLNYDIIPQGEVQRNPCADRWCHTIEVQVAGGRRNRLNGCQQGLIRTMQEKPDDPSVKLLKGVKLPLCDALMNATKSEDGKVCNSIEFTNAAGQKVEGWQCCCNGGKQCNKSLKPEKKNMGTFDLFGSSATAAAAALPALLLGLALAL